jgi:hypothetical protein
MELSQKTEIWRTTDEVPKSLVVWIEMETCTVTNERKDRLSQHENQCLNNAFLTFLTTVDKRGLFEIEKKNLNMCVLSLCGIDIFCDFDKIDSWKDWKIRNFILNRLWIHFIIYFAFCYYIFCCSKKWGSATHELASIWEWVE